MECARSMRLHASLPLNIWEEVVNTIEYLINRGPSAPLGYGIPEEAWTRKKVSYSFLKTLLQQHEKKEKDYVVLDYTPNSDFPVVPHSLQQQPKISQTLMNIRLSKRLSRPLDRFTPSLYSILLIDFSEPKGYDEAMQVDTKVQWELAMKEEMDSLRKN